jgi:formate dehydrogenase major subunit
VLSPEEDIDQRSPIKAMMISGHGGNTVTRIPEMLKAMEQLELLVVADPHPTVFSAISARADNTYLLPIATSLEMEGTRTASNRSLQWHEANRSAPLRGEERLRVPVPARPEARLRRADVQEHQGREQHPDAADILREINRGGWSTGYCGQSPERLQAHMRNQGKFDLVTLRAPKDDPEVGGDYYGLPWPCWGKPELRHPGSPILYRTDVHVMEGRARSGPASARSATARRCSAGELLQRSARISRTGYPGILHGRAQEARAGTRT